MIRIRSKRRILPRGIVRVGTWLSAASKSRLVLVINSNLLQRRGKRLSIELRITPRARKAPYINQHLNSMREENLPKLLGAASRMSYCPDRTNNAEV